MDFGQLRVTYVGDERPVVRAAGIVDRINAQTAKNAAANDRIVERSKKTLADVQMREAKRGADAFIRELERTRRAERQASGAGGGGVGSDLSTLAGGRLAFAGGGAVAGVGALAAGFGAAATAGVKYQATIDQLSQSFKTLLGSQRAAEQHLKELQDFANRTPFEFEDVARASQKFLNMGVSAKDVIPILTSVGNAVARTGGGSQQVEAVSRAIAQVGARGKVSAEEMNQLADALVDGWGPLEKELGKTRGELMKMAEAGQISADTFIAAFRKAHESGRGMADQMNTLTGSTSTLTDSARQALGYAFTPLHDTLRDITVELAKMTTEGWNTERALKAMASATRDFVNATPNSAWFDKWLMLLGGQAGGAAGIYGMAAILGQLPKPPEQTQASGINIPEQFKYKQKISDDDFNKRQQDEFRRAKEAFVVEQERAREEATRKASQEAERQADVLKRISQDYAEASTRVTGFTLDSLQLEAALYKLNNGFHTLSDTNKAAAQADINRLFSAKRELEYLNAKAALQKALAAVIDEHRAGVEADGKATERVNEALATFVDTGAQADGTLRQLAAQATTFAREMDAAAAMVKLAEENSKSFSEIWRNTPLQPGTPTNMMGPELKPLDLSNVGVDYWKTYRESFSESLQYMREDGVQIFADMFARIGEGWRGAASGLVIDFARALNEMAAQAAASAVWGALLNIVGGALGGMFSAGSGAHGAMDTFSHPGYASGTPSASPGLHWVGERGPELVSFRGGEQVFSSQQSKRMAGGAVTNNYYNFNVVMKDTPVSYSRKKTPGQVARALLGGLGRR